MYVSISCSLQFNIICTVCIFIMLFSRQMWGEMYKTADYCRTTMSFFNGK